MGHGRHRLLLTLLALLSALCVRADQGPPVYTAIGSTPSAGGVCSGPRVQIVATTGATWCCVNAAWVSCGGGGGGGGAPVGAYYVTTQADGTLTNERVLPTCTGTDKLTFNGTTISCSVDTGGTPGGSSGNLQTNNGSGGFGAFAGSNCTTDQAPNSISASGAFGGCFDPALIPVYARASRPACGATWLSKEIRLHDAGQADETQVCELDYAGNYAWASYSLAPDTTVAGTMAGGISFVTVGATFGVNAAHPCSFTGVTATSAGSAASTYCTSTSTPCNYQKATHFISIGATQQFQRVVFRVSGRWNLSWAVNNAGQSTFGGGYVASSLDIPYPMTGTLHPTWNLHSAGAGVSSYTYTTHYLDKNTLAASSNRVGYEHGIFGGSGEMRWTLSAGQISGWTMGWNPAGGYPAPSGVNPANYYWMTLAPYETSWGNRCACANCADDGTAVTPQNVTVTVEAVYP